MPSIKYGLLSALIVLSGFGSIRAESTETGQILAQSRELVASGSIDKAIVLVESALERVPEADASILLEQLRKFYVVAISESRKTGQYNLAEQYSHNVKLMDLALGDAVAPETPVEQKPSNPPAPVKELPRINRKNELSAVNPSVETPNRQMQSATEPPQSANRPAVVAPPSNSANTKVQQFELAEADDAFRNKQFDAAGKIYMQLYNSGRLPASRRSHLAYCKCAEIVTKINESPKTTQTWTEIHGELDLVQKIQPDFWFAEYLKDLVKERSTQTTHASKTNSSSTHLASNSGSTVIGRAASQIRSIAINPLRRNETPEQ